MASNQPSIVNVLNLSMQNMNLGSTSGELPSPEQVRVRNSGTGSSESSSPNLGNRQTQQITKFIEERMGQKLVKDVPGIGDISVKKLNKKRYITAVQLYGKYLSEGAEAFQTWLLKMEVPASYATTCCSALTAYRNKFPV